MLLVEGIPTGAAGWRDRVAAAARPSPLVGGEGLVVSFALPAGRWVDLDTLVESTLAGLRDAGLLQPRYAGLDAVVATKETGNPSGVRVAAAPAASLARRRPPGPVGVVATSAVLPRPGRRDDKRAWRDALAVAHRGRPPLTGPVWADVALRTGGSLLAPLEVTLDALEPVLGRDPRGRAWQEFFPNDHLVEWLRVRRTRGGAAVRLSAGPVGPVDAGATAPAAARAP